MKLLVINNLSAGPGDGAVYDFVRVFSHGGDEVVLRMVDEYTDFASVLSDSSRFDRVVVAGGDGTIARACYELRYSGIPVVVFPSGTANLIAQNIMHPLEVPALAKLAREGTTMDFDMGEFDFGGNRIGFMMMAGCGFDAQLMSSAKSLKERLGAVAYFRAALDNVAPPVANIALDIDGKRFETSGVGVVCMNFSKVQFDVSFGPANLPADGQLDVCVLATKNAVELLLPAIGAALDRSGKALKQSEALQYFRGREIRVETDPPLSVEYDGDATDLTTPFVARVLPHATKLVVTQECIEEFSSN